MAQKKGSRRRRGPSPLAMKRVPKVTKYLVISRFRSPQAVAVAVLILGVVAYLWWSQWRMEPVAVFDFEHEYVISDLAFSSNGDLLYVAGGKSVSCCDVDEEKINWVLTLPDKVRAFDLVPEARLLAVVVKGESEIRLYSETSGKSLGRVDASGPRASDITFYSEGARRAVSEGPAFMKSAYARRAIWRLAQPNGRRMILSPDAHTFAAASGGSEVRILDAATGEKLDEWFQEMPGVGSLVFSPKGDCIALRSFGPRVTVWDTNGRQRWRVRVKGPSAIAFSGDGETLVVAVSDLLWLLNASDGSRQALVSGRARITHVAFSRDNRWLAASDARNKILVWRRSGRW